MNKSRSRGGSSGPSCWPWTPRSASACSRCARNAKYTIMKYAIMCYIYMYIYTHIHKNANECHNPDFLGFSLAQKMVFERFSWGVMLFGVIRCLQSERFWGCLKSHATIPLLKVRVSRRPQPAADAPGDAGPDGRVPGLPALDSEDSYYLLLYYVIIVYHLIVQVYCIVYYIVLHYTRLYHRTPPRSSRAWTATSGPSSRGAFLNII